MAPNRSYGTSTSIAVVSTPVATATESTLFADQSGSRLMTLPKELRNMIYEFVFCDNLTYAREVIANQWSLKSGHPVPDPDSSEALAADMWKFSTETAYVPRLVRLDKQSPPSKNSILLCRELYFEMKQMHVAAYRSYWASNRFLYIDREMSNPAELPAEENVRRIREFHLAFGREYNLRLVFEDSKWTTWLLSADGRSLDFLTVPQWADVHHSAQGAVTKYLASVGSVQDPRAGRGLTRSQVAALSRIRTVHVLVQLVGDARNFLEREAAAHSSSA